MGLNRTALRLATVMCLANGFVGPFPTMAKGRVFDSRFDPLQVVDLTEVIPIITVCTDNTQGESLSRNNGGPPFEDTCTLVLEVSIGMAGEMEDSDERFIGLPQTEPELEAMLDLFERQIKVALVHPTNPWSIEFQRHARRITDWNSERFVEAEGNIRLAARKMSATVMLQLEELTDVVTTTPLPSPSIPAPLGPLLDLIIASGSPFAPAATQMQDLLLDNGASQPVSLEPLERVRIFERHDITTNGAGTKKGPRVDGVAEVELPQA
jgi:hypothetical protein